MQLVNKSINAQTPMVDGGQPPPREMGGNSGLDVQTLQDGIGTGAVSPDASPNVRKMQILGDQSSNVEQAAVPGDQEKIEA